jgi:hypothetical protein
MGKRRTLGRTLLGSSVDSLMISATDPSLRECPSGKPLT